jgi:hypothetical protein
MSYYPRHWDAPAAAIAGARVLKHAYHTFMDDLIYSDASRLNRRDFSKLTAAAFTGILLGAALQARAADAKPGDKPDPKLLLGDKHVCRGLNTCKAKGKGKDNSCAGAGSCSSFAAHGCGGANACKGQGGCEETAGQNACKSKGNCNVPLEDKTWKKTRKAFEAQMKKAGKPFKDAPKKAA